MSAQRGQEGPPDATRTEFRVLGPVEASRDGVALDLGPRKQRAVLALLLLDANRVVPTETLIDQLWGDAPPETARSALQVYVAGLRKALGAGGAALATRSPGYVLAVEDGALDLDRFAALRDEARATGDVRQRSALLHEALALWRGTPLAELDGEPFGVTARLRFEELRLAALEERIDADLALGRHAALVPELDALAADHPYRERLRAQQMLALYRSGRQADALAAYRAAREASVEDLGIEPGPELRALERAVLDQDPALDAPAVEPEPVAPGTTLRGRGRPTWLLAGAAAALVAVVAAIALVLVLRREPAAIVAPPNSVAVIDADSRRVVGWVPVSPRPGAIAAGGRVIWVANLADETLTRIDAETRRVIGIVPLPGSPDGLALAFDAVWVVHGRLGELSSVDPAFPRDVQTFAIGSRARRFARGAVAPGLGSLWAAFGDASLARVDPQSPRESSSAYAGGGPAAIVVAGGHVWVANLAGSNVQRFNPLTFDQGPVERLTVGESPVALAAGAGSVWVASAGDDQVARIHWTATSSSSQSTIPVGDAPGAIAYGEGAVWVANGGEGTVWRIDPETNKVTDEIPVGGAPSGIVVAGGEVWVTVQAP